VKENVDENTVTELDEEGVAAGKILLQKHVHHAICQKGKD
jgi:hypothetical protein